MEALQHQFFDELRDKHTKLPNNVKIPNLFNFSLEEIISSTPDQIRQLIPEWYLKRKGIKFKEPILFSDEEKEILDEDGKDAAQRDQTHEDSLNTTREENDTM